MRIERFSPKQLKALTWWCENSPNRKFDGIICDGAIRSGKTICMAISFFTWACARFDRQAFALCGKTIASLRRNVVTPLLGILSALGFACREKVSSNLLEVAFEGRRNRFYLFGGRDESSAALIQGMTLAGVLFDEVALMPRSFVEQALARCSVEGSAYWFNCNPENPYHWFYQEWILKSAQKNMLYLHFKMCDNPSLSANMIGRYEALYSGVFYERFIKGRWVCCDGLVYDMFDPALHVATEVPGQCEKYYISCDYGTVNPASFGLWGEHQGVFYRLREFYYDSKKQGRQMTDEEYYGALRELAGGRKIEAVVVDPSAASFIACIARHGEFYVEKGKNDVIDGIRRVGDCLKAKRLMFCQGCRDAIREFSLYKWNENGANDAVRKENDHAMDDIRYFVSTIVYEEEDDFFVASIGREV